jgi:hypothetical protein
MLTAAQAIRKECRFCNTQAQTECVTKVCNLHPEVWTGKRSKVRQIRAHCLECAGSTDQVKSCDGKLLRKNDNENICYLHPYRAGKNPAKAKRAASPEQIAALSRARRKNTA